MSQIVPAELLDPRPRHSVLKPLLVVVDREHRVLRTVDLFILTMAAAFSGIFSSSLA